MRFFNSDEVVVDLEAVVGAVLKDNHPTYGTVRLLYKDKDRVPEDVHFKTGPVAMSWLKSFAKVANDYAKEKVDRDRLRMGGNPSG